MYICICRSLKESDFETEQEKNERLLQDDCECGKCIEEFVDVDKIGHLGREFDSPHLHQKHTTASVDRGNHSFK